MGVNAIGAIGRGDEDKKTSYSTGAQKRKPWEDIGSLINGFGSIGGLPSEFNSAFTVGKGGGRYAQGAFGA